jgi:hypothetical protein
MLRLQSRRNPKERRIIGLQAQIRLFEAFVVVIDVIHEGHAAFYEALYLLLQADKSLLERLPLLESQVRKHRLDRLRYRALKIRWDHILRSIRLLQKSKLLSIVGVHHVKSFKTVLPSNGGIHSIPFLHQVIDF